MSVSSAARIPLELPPDGHAGPQNRRMLSLAGQCLFPQVGVSICASHQQRTRLPGHPHRFLRRLRFYQSEPPWSWSPWQSLHTNAAEYLSVCLTPTLVHFSGTRLITSCPSAGVLHACRTRTRHRLHVLQVLSPLRGLSVYILYSCFLINMRRGVRPLPCDMSPSPHLKFLRLFHQLSCLTGQA